MKFLRPLVILTLALLLPGSAFAQKSFAVTFSTVDPAQLRTECLTNPNNYTYTFTDGQGQQTTQTLTQWYTQQADSIVATILNTTRAGINIPRTDVRSQEIRETINLLDLDTTTSGAKQAWLTGFLNASDTTQLRRWNAGRTSLVDTLVLTNLINSMGNTNGSETRLRTQIAIRTGSRAEQLWSCVSTVYTGPGCENVTVTTADVSAARALP